jgi:hypothetical protein
METKKIEVQCVHQWVPQITGDVENIEACEECLETRVVIAVQHLPSDYPPSDEAIMAEIADQEFSWGEERVAQDE